MKRADARPSRELLSSIHLALFSGLGERRIQKGEQAFGPRVNDTGVCCRAMNSPSPSRGEAPDRRPGVGASGMGWCRRRRQGRRRCFSTRASGVQPLPPPAPAPSPPATPAALAHLPLSDEGGQLLGPLVHEADMLDGVDQGFCIIWAGAEGKDLGVRTPGPHPPTGSGLLKGLQNPPSIGATQLSHSQTRGWGGWGRGERGGAPLSPARVACPCGSLWWSSGM